MRRSAASPPESGAGSIFSLQPRQPATLQRLSLRRARATHCCEFLQGVSTALCIVRSPLQRAGGSNAVVKFSATVRVTGFPSFAAQCSARAVEATVAVRVAASTTSTPPPAAIPPPTQADATRFLEQATFGPTAADITLGRGIRCLPREPVQDTEDRLYRLLLCPAYRPRPPASTVRALPPVSRACAPATITRPSRCSGSSLRTRLRSARPAASARSLRTLADLGGVRRRTMYEAYGHGGLPEHCCSMTPSSISGSCSTDMTAEPGHGSLSRHGWQ